MYSIVLLMSLSGGTEVADCHRHGCCGCYGGYRHGCCGYNYNYGCCGNTSYCGCCGEAAPKKEEKKGDVEEENRISSQQAQPGKVVVRLPADARLTVNGTASKSQKVLRTFAIRTIPAGGLEVALKAEVTRGDQTYTASRTVRVRSGERSEVTLAFPELTTQAALAK